MLNNNQVIQTPYKKHLGINDKLKFLKPLLKKLTSPSNYYVNFRGSYQDHHELLYTVYKSCIGTHLQYRNMIFDHAYCKSFHKKLESIDYMTITYPGRSTLKEKLYYKLGLELLVHGHWFSDCTRSVTKISLCVIFMTYYLFRSACTSQDHLTINLVFILNAFFSKILFSFLQ